MKQAIKLLEKGVRIKLEYGCEVWKEENKYFYTSYCILNGYVKHEITKGAAKEIVHNM
jgi:hypothetical protein